jgi:hypothetical protein
MVARPLLGVEPWECLAVVAALADVLGAVPRRIFGGRFEFDLVPEPVVFDQLAERTERVALVEVAEQRGQAGHSQCPVS